MQHFDNLGGIEKSLTDFQSYKCFLLSDFEKHKEFASLATAISFTNAPTISNWIEGLQGTNFRNFRQTSSFKGIVPSGADLIKDISHTFTYFFNENIEDVYVFFSKKESDSYEVIAKEYSKYNYYVFDSDFFKKVNVKLLTKFPDYAYDSKAGVYKKQIYEGVFLKLTPYKGFTKYSIIQDYIFPQISVEVNGKDIYIFSPPNDVRSFLLLWGTSFSLFTVESNVVLLSDDGERIAGMEPKKGEPLIYEDIENHKFILTNSYEKLRAYNKYIYVVMELYCYYLRVFERWITNSLSKP